MNKKKSHHQAAHDHADGVMGGALKEITATTGLVVVPPTGRKRKR